MVKIIIICFLLLIFLGCVSDRNTYQVYVGCVNCEYRSAFHNIRIHIPKGISTEDALRNVRCPECGIIGRLFAY